VTIALEPPPISTLTAEPPLAPPTPQAEPSVIRRVLQDRGALLDEVIAGKRHDMTRVVWLSFAMVALGGLGLGVSSSHGIQALVAALKMPAILVGALLVCGPAFYISGVLAGSKLRAGQALRIFAVGMGLRGAIIAALAPLLLFFASVGSPYGFLLLTGALVFGLGEIAFLRTVERAISKLRETGDAFSVGLTRVWMVVYLAVAAQLTWTFRPLIGHPDEVWMLFGGRGNMYTYIVQNVSQMF